MTRLLGLTIAATALLPAVALAAPDRIRGTVASVTADTLTVHTTAGTDVLVSLRDNTKYLQVVPSSLDKIDSGSYIGTATKTVGGKLIALEVVVFPPAMKGTGDGHYGWDRIPDTTLSGSGSTSSTMTNGSVSQVSGGGSVNSTMTNGSVTQASGKGGAKTLTVTYKGGEQTVLVPPTAPIVGFQPGAKSDVTTGATVFVNGTETDGKVSANAVAVGTNGVKPPM